MREEIEQHISEAEEKIAAALQDFHNKTGLIPVSFEFAMVDVRTMDDLTKGRKAVRVGERKLKANI